MTILFSLLLLTTGCPETHVMTSSPSMVQFEVRFDTTMVEEMIASGMVHSGSPLIVATGGAAEASWRVLTPPIRIAAPCTVDTYTSTDMVRITGEGYLRNVHLSRVCVRPFQVRYGHQVLYPRILVTLRWSPVRGTNSDRPERFTDTILETLLVNSRQMPYLVHESTVSVDRSTPPPSPSCRIRVEERGIYRGTADDFAAAGVPVSGAETAHLRLWYRGEEQRLRIEDDGDGLFQGSDAVVFYAEGRHRKDPEGRDDPYVSLYSREAVYWLSWGGSQPGLRWTEVDGTPDTGDPDAVWYRHLVHAEEENEIIIAFHNEAYNNSLEWFWQKLPASTVLRQFEIPTTEIVAADTFVLRAGIQGAADIPVHHTEFHVNGTLVDTVWWGYDGGRDTLIYDSGDRGKALETALLSEGSTTIGIKELNDGPAGSSTKSYLNWIELRYPREHAALDSSLGFSGPAGAADDACLFTVRGFPDDETAVVNLSRGEWITGAVVSNDSLSFSADVSESDSLWAEYLPAVNPISDIQPYEVLDPPLDDTSRAADYLIVTPREFMGPADTLAQAVEARFDRTTDSIGIQDIYDYFSYGELQPRAVRNFLEAAYDNWSDPPTHVCLLGDATWDFLGHSEVYTETNRVPTWGNPGNDYYFTRLTHDGQDEYDWIPDIALGRLPARDLADARNMVQKTVSYLETDLWSKELLMMAHGSSDWENTSFRSMSDLLADYAVPSGLLPTFSTIYGDSLGYQYERSYKDDFMYAWFADPLLIHFIGRGDFYTWCMELHTSMTDTMQSPEIPPFMVGGSCHSGRFALPDSSCLGERLLRSPDSRSGSSGIVSSTGITSTSNVYIWATYALPLLLDADPLTVGEANVAGIVQAGDFLSQRFILLSDPALSLVRPRGPDMGFRDDWFRTMPEDPVEGDPDIWLSLDVANLGSSATDEGDSCWVAVVDSTPSGTALQVGMIRTAIPSHGDSVLTIPWIPSPERGTHRLLITVDTEDEVDELNENNNEEIMPVDVFFAAPDPYSPEDAAALCDQIVQLSVQSIPAESGITYQFQLGSDPLFSHPDSFFMESSPVPPGEYYTVWNPPSPPGDVVLYWRCRGMDGDVQGKWTDTRSFIVDRTADHGGWEQSHWGQFSADSLHHCSIDTGSSRIVLFLQTGDDIALADSGASILSYSSSNPNFQPEAVIGEGAFIFGNNDTDQTLIIDLGSQRDLLKVGAEFWAGAMDRGVWSELEISTSSDGSSFNPWITYGPYAEPSLEIPPRVFTEVDEAVPSRYIRARFGIGCPQTSGVNWGSRIYEIYAFRGESPQSGDAFGPVIGPALTWRSLDVEALYPDVSDSLFVTVRGYSVTGGIWETVEGFESLYAPGVWDMSGIDTDEYPWIRLQAVFMPSSDQGPALESWSVRFDPR